MDKEIVMARLRKHAEKMDSSFLENARYMQANKRWIRRSQDIAIIMLNKMDELHLTQVDVAERMGCTQQYVSKLLKGQENLSLETMVKIEDALEVELLVRTLPAMMYEPQEPSVNKVAESAVEYKK